jgi:hypothetical protein
MTEKHLGIPLLGAPMLLCLNTGIVRGILLEIRRGDVRYFRDGVWIKEV